MSKTERVRNPLRSTPVNVIEYSKSVYVFSTTKDTRDDETCRGSDLSLHR